MPDEQPTSPPSGQSLKRCDLQPDPLNQFRIWFYEARTHVEKLPEAMALASVDSDGYPRNRMVLLKGFDENGFVFYTNHGSHKADQLEKNPRASLLFHWKELQRQVRILGWAEKISREETDKYFQARPRGSQLSAWASYQSSVLKDRDELETAMRELERQYEGRPVPVPPFWGGYRISIGSMEFWQGRPDRLHDRFLYRRGEQQAWNIERLAP